MNVYDAAIKRLDVIFNEFDNIYVSFSGGKDSGVLLNLVFQYMRKNKISKKIGVYYMDYEGSYYATEEFIKRMVEDNAELIDLYWVCLTYKTACGVSMYDNFWLPWNPDQKNIWVRDFPKLKNGLQVIKEKNQNFDFYYKGIEDSDFDKAFSLWYHKKNNSNKTIGLLGIRTEESLNRWRAVNANRVHMYKKYNWTVKEHDNVFHAYPIYDWRVNDIWIANSKFNWDYNKIYDLYYRAGLSPHQMRVASAFIDEGVISLKLHKVIEPHKWAKLVGRVNGANFGAIYGGTKANGYKNISLPKGHTWKTYCEFLLDTLPKHTRLLYERKFANSFKVWLKEGAALKPEVITKLKKQGIAIQDLGKPTRNINYNGDRVQARFYNYPDEIDHPDFKDLPSYKRMCITILKNDTSCKYMGYAQTKYERELRQKAIKKYRDIL